MLIESDTFRQHWPLLTPKVRDRWPRLSEADIREIDGDLERLARKVHEHYGWTRSDVMAELTIFLQPAERDEHEVEAGTPKLGEHTPRR